MRRFIYEPIENGGPGSGHHPGSGADLSQKAKELTGKTKGLTKGSDEANEAHDQAAKAHRAASENFLLRQ